MGNYDATSAYDGKFTTSGFDLDESIAKDLGFDDIVTFVVTARVVGDNRKETRIGSLKKTNVFKVINCVPLSDGLMRPVPFTDSALGIYDDDSALNDQLKPWTPDDAVIPPEPSEERILIRPKRDPVLDRFLDE